MAQGYDDQQEFLMKKRTGPTETIPVFISVGKRFRKEQSDFLQALIEYLKKERLDARVVGLTAIPSCAPLPFIKEQMEECAGTIVLAFERIHVTNGLEQRNAENTNDEQRITQENIATPWNQVEAGMAVAYGHPIFTLMETGVRQGGLLDKTMISYLHEISLSTTTLLVPAFTQGFIDWRERVEEFDARRWAMHQARQEQEILANRSKEALEQADEARAELGKQRERESLFTWLGKRTGSEWSAIVGAFAAVAVFAYWLGTKWGT